MSVKTHICEATSVHYQIAMLAMKNKYRELENEILSLIAYMFIRRKSLNTWRIGQVRISELFKSEENLS